MIFLFYGMISMLKTSAMGMSSVYHLDHAVDRVDPLDRSGDSLVAQRRKSSNCLRQTFERKLVDTAHFQNKGTVLQ